MVLTGRGRGRGESGAVLVLVAFLIVTFLAVTSLVVDLGNARQVGRHSQASADAGALAGAPELPVASEAVEKAAKYVNQNLTGSFTAPAPDAGSCPQDTPAGSTCYKIGNAKVAVKTPYSLGSGIPASRLIYVRICEPTGTFFAGAIGATSPTVCRDAVGRRVESTGGFGMGLISLSPTACPGLLISGTSNTTLSSNGAVMINSECEPAMRSTGSAWDLQADYIGVVGSADLHPCEPPSNTDCTTTVPDEGIDHFNDPFNLTPPSTAGMPAGTCPSSSGPPGIRIANPGRYSAACSYNGGTNKPLILRSGLYYFDAGFTYNGDAPIVCSDAPTPTLPASAGDCSAGITFVIAGGGFTLNGGTQVSLPPPSSGPYEGISLYQMSASPSQIQGTANFTMGTIYAPNAPLTFTGNAGSDGVNIVGSVLGSTIELSGTFRFNIEVPEDGPTTPGEDDIGLER